MLTTVIIKNPFNVVEREIKSMSYVPLKTAFEYIQPHVMGLDEYYVNLNGETVDDLSTVPNDGDYILVIPHVGKSGKNIFAMIAQIALMVYAPELAGNMAGGFTGNAFKLMKGIYTVALTAIGGALINHFFPPPKADTGATKDTAYNWANMADLSAQGAALAKTYGTVQTSGIKLAEHITTNGEKQYYNVLLCGGEGPVDVITDITINDNPIENYVDDNDTINGRPWRDFLENGKVVIRRENEPVKYGGLLEE